MSRQPPKTDHERRQEARLAQEAAERAKRRKELAKMKNDADKILKKSKGGNTRSRKRKTHDADEPSFGKELATAFKIFGGVILFSAWFGLALYLLLGFPHPQTTFQSFLMIVGGLMILIGFIVIAAWIMYAIGVLGKELEDFEEETGFFQSIVSKQLKDRKDNDDPLGLRKR